MEACIIFPHQLFKEHPGLAKGRKVYLVENDLFFLLYPFHKQKLVFHRASMKAYQDELIQQGFQTFYINSKEHASSTDGLAALLVEDRISHVYLADVADDWLQRRLEASLSKKNIEQTWLSSPGFILTNAETWAYPVAEKNNLQATFYRHMRKKYRVMVDERGEPEGGQWSYDSDNRKRYPTGKLPPHFHRNGTNPYVEEAIQYVNKEFAGNPGSIDKFFYPVTETEARQWLNDFIETRFREFGPYEDAMVHRELLLHHSLLSPLINAGLITPADLIQTIQTSCKQHAIPLASKEGFIRQVLGWREYIRLIYVKKGRQQRTRNYWGFNRKVPPSWWSGTTGIAPVDLTIEKVKEHGYCHHIERLMVLGNFMLLCEFDPESVYEWFMSLFIDAYDWVMVPNVYGMSQFADGGLMCTKPYISGSNYLLKMGDFPKGDWQHIWDALFWRFMHIHRSFFSQNPRLGMLLKTYDRMPEEKRNQILRTAESYLQTL